MSDAPDRRQTPRHLDADQHGVVSTRVRPGHRAKVIDISAGGALIETTHRLLPGTSVELHVETREHQTNVRGRVLRCAIVLVRPSWVCYRGAIGFERHLPWLAADDSGAPACAASRSALPARAVATHEVI
jgi:hypothetical protein